MTIRWTRRQVLKAGAATWAVGCTPAGSDVEAQPAPDSGADAQEVPQDVPQDAPPARADSAPDDPDPVEPREPVDPQLRPEMWHTCAAWARHDEAAGVGTRINLFNPADVPMVLDLHLFQPDGSVAIQEHAWRTLAPAASAHPTVGELLAQAGLKGPFAGTLWIGSKPESGPTYLGLQGFSADWYGPSHHAASVHGMRDFGNSNHDAMWTDLVLPRIVSGERFETVVAIANAAGTGADLPREAQPQITIVADGGEVLGELAADPIPAFGARLLRASAVLGNTPVENGAIRVQEPEVGLVVIAFVEDKKYGGFVNADHFFDRNFVDCVPLGSSNPCSAFLEPF